MNHHPEPWDKASEAEYHDRFSKQFHDWLDEGMGSCVLKTPSIAKIVADALLFFDGDRCDVDCFVVMPNHVHALVTPRAPYTVSQLVKSWKSHTGRQLNLALNRTGTLWQEDYWDRLIRSDHHFLTCRNYIRENPRAAKLREGEFILYERKEGGSVTHL